MKKLILGMVLLIVILSACACGCSKLDKNYVYDGKSLVGAWQEKNLDDQQYQTFEFFSDGTIIKTIYSFGIEMAKTEATYEVEDDNILIIKQASGTDMNNFSISRKNVLVLCPLFGTKDDEIELVPYDSAYNKSNSDILGTWRSADNKTETFTFYEDYTGKAASTVGEDNFLYSLKDGNLFISYTMDIDIKAPVETVSYTVEGDVLTLSGTNQDGTTLTLTFERDK